MKVILDCAPERMGSALTLFFRVTSQNPTQEVGKNHAIIQNVGDVRMAVIKNFDSYTVREVV